MPPHVLSETHAGTWAAANQFSFRPEAAEYLRRCRRPVRSVGRDPERMSWEQDLLSHPRSRTVCWEAAGHWLHHERPRDFADLVVEWLHSLQAP